MKKILFAVALLLGSKAVAQDYYHGLGLGYNIGLYNLSYNSPTSNLTSFSALGTPMIIYKGTFGFEVSRSTTFGVSFFPGVGGFVSNFGTLLGYQLPVLGEFYFGDMDDRHFNIGAGFGFTGIVGSTEGGTIMGPQIAIGGQFEFRGQLIEMRGTYTLGLNRSKLIPSDATEITDKKSMIGISVIYPFGQ